jgi:hypothetical protein
MDNVFEILIYLIIIISFLSSIFKKRQKPQQRPQQRPQRDNYEQQDVAVSETQSKEDYDVLKEIEDFFKVGSEQYQQGKRVPVERESLETDYRIEETPTTETLPTTSAAETFRNEIDKQREELKIKRAMVDSAVEEKAKQFEKLLATPVQPVKSVASTIKTKLSNPQNISEYIVFSEILGKPKALRR